jgi:hypothetical protein
MSLDPVSGFIYRVADIVLLRTRRRPDVEFFTRLPLQECRERLSQAIDTRVFRWGFRPDKPVVGRMSGNRFYFCKRYTYRNMVYPILYGTLTDSPQGTYVRGVFRLHPLTIVYVVVLLGFWLALLFERVATGRAMDWSELLWRVAWFAPLLLFGLAVLGVHSLIARRSKPYLATYLRRALATPVPGTQAHATFLDTLDSASAAHTAPSSSRVVYKSIDFRFVLVAGAVGLACLTALSLLGQIDSTDTAFFFSWIPLLEDFVPIVTGVLFVLLSTASGKVVHPFSMIAGSALAGVMLGLFAEMARLDPHFFFPPLQFLYIGYGIEAPVSSVAHLILLTLSYAFLTGIGGYSGWLVFAKKEFD